MTAHLPEQSRTHDVRRGTLPIPGLELVLGAANSGKLGEVLSWRDRWSTLDPVIVVPTIPVAHEVTRELARRVGVVFGPSPALTFDGLVREVLGRHPPLVGDFERELLVAGLLGDPGFTALEPAAHFPGLVTVVAGLLQRLEESDRTPEHAEEALSRWAVDTPAKAELAADLRLLMGRYRALCLRRGVIERAATVRRAAELVDGWKRPVAFYGFTSFTPGQRRLISNLMAHVPVLLTFDHERSRVASLVSNAEVARWEQVATSVRELPPQSRAYSSPQIARLERLLFNRHGDGEVETDEAVVARPGASGHVDVGAAAQEEGVHLLLAAGERSEAELVAQHISALIRRGFRPGDVGVIVRDVSGRGRLVGQALASCGIPYRLDESPQLAFTGIGHAFLRAVRGLALADAASLFEFLTGPYSGLSSDEAVELRRRYVRAPVQDMTALTTLVEAARPGLLASLWPHPAGLSETPFPDSRIDVAAMLALARCMLSAGTEAFGCLDEHVDADASAFAALARALERVDADVHVSVETFLDCLGRLRCPGPAAEVDDAVTILTPRRARARRFAAVFIAGLVEGEFPGRPDPPSLLSRNDRAQLARAAGGDLLEDEDEDEQALFLSAVARAWQVLYLSARDADEGGAEVQTSHFWRHAKDLLGLSVPEEGRRALADLVYPVEVAPGTRHLRRARALAHASPDPHHDPLRRPPTSLKEPAVLAELASTSSFSPSTLESYLSCPFAWFLEKVVGVEDLERGVDARSVGMLVHAAAKSVYEPLVAKAERLRVDGVDAALERASAAIDRLAESGRIPGTPAARRVAAARARLLAHRLVLMEAASDGRLVPARLESEVGGDDGVDIGGLRIRGRVDRIDAHPVAGSRFVIDYKTGMVPSKGRIGTAEALQLPLYLLALQAEGGGWVMGGVYVGLSGGERSGVVFAEAVDEVGSAAGGCRALTADEATLLYEGTRELAIQAADGIRAGRIVPRVDGSCPSWCDFGEACRSRRGAWRP